MCSETQSSMKPSAESRRQSAFPQKYGCDLQNAGGFLPCIASCPYMLMEVVATNWFTLKKGKYDSCNLLVSRDYPQEQYM